MNRWIAILLAMAVAGTLVGGIVMIRGGTTGGEPGAATQTNKKTDDALAVIVDHSRWTFILQRYVRDGEVDYDGIARNHLDKLDRYLDAMAKIEVDQLSRDEQLAYYINLYNATVVREVCRQYKPGFSLTGDSFAFFKAPVVRTDMGTMSLEDLRNGIRAAFREPAVHGALVDGARSSPDLRDVAYTGRDIGGQLQESMREFVRDQTRNPVDAAHREVRASLIFEWYADDFGGGRRVLDFLNKDHQLYLGGFKVRPAAWDWTLNRWEPR